MNASSDNVLLVLPLRAKVGLLVAPLLLVVALLCPPPEGLSVAGFRAAVIGLMMAVLWVTEALPVPVTGLIPLALFPLIGIADMKQTAAPYADPVIYLFMGGFMLSLAMQRWNLHQRIALTILSRVGSHPSQIIAGFLVVTAVLSMWVSNTATALMMLPIGLSVAEMWREGGGEEEETQGRGAHSIAKILMLTIAYGATIGGLATPIGTPPNAFLVGFMRTSLGVEVGFGQWMMLGVPVVLVALPVTYLVLTRVTFRLPTGRPEGLKAELALRLKQLGPPTPGEWITAGVFMGAAFLWIFRPWISGQWPALSGMSDAGIAMTAALVLFATPVRGMSGERVLDWQQARKLPWDVLVLFGGGLSLAGALQSTAFTAWLGGHAGAMAGLPVWLIILVTCTTILILSELASNTAIAATFLPIIASLAIGLDLAPLLLVAPAALSASCAFMLPVGTPPNAIAYSSGKITLPEMARAGFWLNVVFLIIVTCAGVLLVERIFYPA